MQQPDQHQEEEQEVQEVEVEPAEVLVVEEPTLPAEPDKAAIKRAQLTAAREAKKRKKKQREEVDALVISLAKERDELKAAAAALAAEAAKPVRVTRLQGDEKPPPSQPEEEEEKKKQPQTFANTAGFPVIAPNMWREGVKVLLLGVLGLATFYCKDVAFIQAQPSTAARTQSAAGGGAKKKTASNSIPVRGSITRLAARNRVRGNSRADKAHIGDSGFTFDRGE